MTGSGRVESVDIFRGLTMLVMIFVNDLASVKGLPWWTYHMPGRVNGMTYVDVVFPAFLFIVGMAIPLSVQRRIDKGDSMPRLWFHILIRSVSLVALGLLLANEAKVDARLTGVGAGTWGLMGLAGAVMLWNVYPRTAGRQTLYRGLKWAGLALLAAMFVIFRRTTADGQAAWLDFSYWEILGLIGRAYLAACLLYIPLRHKPWAPPVLLAALTLLNVSSRLGWTPFLKYLPRWLWPFGSGDLASVVMAGIVAATIFLTTDTAQDFRRKALWGLGFAAILFAAGWATSPLGIRKNSGTPAWCLLSSGISVLLFLALYWIADVKGWTRWAAFVKPAGSNTLLTYLLPDFFYFAFGVTYASAQLNYGWEGAVRAAVFTAIMLGASGMLSRLGLRMQL